MTAPLSVLSTCRSARRDTANARLAQARGEQHAAYIACQKAHAAWTGAVQSRLALLSRSTLEAHPTLRGSLMPGCEALARQCQQQLLQAQAALRAANEKVAACLEEWRQRERETLRVQEWQTLQQTQDRREQHLRDELADEELGARGAPGS